MENPSTFIDRLNSLYCDTIDAITKLFTLNGITEFEFEDDAERYTFWSNGCAESFDADIVKIEVEDGFITLYDSDDEEYDCGDLVSKGEIVWLYHALYYAMKAKDTLVA